MEIVSTPFPIGFHCSPKAFLGCSSLDYPVPLKRFRPVVCKSKKIKCAILTYDLFTTHWSPKLNQLRLFRMNGQFETVKPLWQYIHNLSGIFFLLETNDNDISIPYQETFALHSWLDFFDKPIIQHIMQEDVSQQEVKSLPLVESQSQDNANYLLPELLRQSHFPISRNMLLSLTRFLIASRNRSWSMLSKNPLTTASNIQLMFMPMLCFRRR